MKIKVPEYVADKLDGLRKKDFNVQTFRASGPGGQHRNKVETAVRITHIATGVTAEATNSRSQADNKKAAFQKLVMKLVAYYKEEGVKERKINLGWGEKIRTYHEPRGVVKDHRTGVEASYAVVLDGGIDCFIDAMVEKEIE
jgi:peptide chain release factor 2